MEFCLIVIVVTIVGFIIGTIIGVPIAICSNANVALKFCSFCNKDIFIREKNLLCPLCKKNLSD